MGQENAEYRKQDLLPHVLGLGIRAYSKNRKHKMDEFVLLKM
jgi:hypothetical protein